MPFHAECRGITAAEVFHIYPKIDREHSLFIQKWIMRVGYGDPEKRLIKTIIKAHKNNVKKIFNSKSRSIIN